jgi:hypothetical protein
MTGASSSAQTRTCSAGRAESRRLPGKHESIYRKKFRRNVCLHRDPATRVRERKADSSPLERSSANPAPEHMHRTRKRARPSEPNGGAASLADRCILRRRSLVADVAKSVILTCRRLVGPTPSHRKMIRYAGSPRPSRTRSRTAVPARPGGDRALDCRSFAVHHVQQRPDRTLACVWGRVSNRPTLPHDTRWSGPDRRSPRPGAAHVLLDRRATWHKGDGVGTKSGHDDDGDLRDSLGESHDDLGCHDRHGMSCGESTRCVTFGVGHLALSNTSAAL